MGGIYTGIKTFQGSLPIHSITIVGSKCSRPRDEKGATPSGTSQGPNRIFSSIGRTSACVNLLWYVVSRKLSLSVVILHLEIASRDTASQTKKADQKVWLLVGGKS